jgi:hypothetical protein
LAACKVRWQDPIESLPSKSILHSSNKVSNLPAHPDTYYLLLLASRSDPAAGALTAGAPGHSLHGSVACPAPGRLRWSAGIGIKWSALFHPAVTVLGRPGVSGSSPLFFRWTAIGRRVDGLMVDLVARHRALRLTHRGTWTPLQSCFRDVSCCRRRAAVIYQRVAAATARRQHPGMCHS